MAPSKKKKAPPPAPKNKVTVKQGGSINAKRDVIVGDQIIYGGQYYAAGNLNIATVSTPKEFIEQLRRVQDEIALLKQSEELSPSQARRIEVVEGDIVEVIEQAQKPNPLPSRINQTLSDAKETMDKIGGSVKSALKLGAALGMLGELALKVFGG